LPALHGPDPEIELNADDDVEEEKGELDPPAERLRVIGLRALLQLLHGSSFVASPVPVTAERTQEGVTKVTGKAGRLKGWKAERGVGDQVRLATAVFAVSDRNKKMKDEG
jgi:hypothetical protein